MRCWMKIVGPIRAITPDGRIVADTVRVWEWCPDLNVAEGW